MANERISLYMRILKLMTNYCVAVFLLIHTKFSLYFKYFCYLPIVNNYIKGGMFNFLNLNIPDNRGLSPS